MSIKRKLILITLVFSIFIILLMGMNYFVMNTLSTVRAYVAGEAFYSKGQKDATYFLARYANTHREEEYVLFLENIKIPIGDRIAREEMQKENTNYEIVDQGLIQAKNYADETREVAKLFKRFGWISYFEESVSYWTQGDMEVQKLLELGEEIHMRIQKKDFTKTHAEMYLKKIDELNKKMTFLEGQYSNTLGAGVRWVTSLLFYVSFILTILGFIFAAWVGTKIAQDILKNIELLKQGTIQVEKGILSTPIKINSLEASNSKDELIQLAISFNKMTEGLEKAIKERDNANEKLELRAKQLSEAQEMAHVGSWELDIETNKLSASDEFYRIFGLPRVSELTTDFLMTKVHPMDQERMKKELENAVKNQELFMIDYKIVLDNGNIRELSQQGRPVKEASGKITKLVGSTQDMTERFQFQMQMIQSNKMASLGEMASGIAHEINNPLAIIKMLALQMQRTTSSDELNLLALKNSIVKIDSTVDRISKIIQGLRTFSRDGKNDPFELVSFDTLLEEIIGFCQERLKDNSIELIKDNINSDMAFEGRQVEISQVILNLLNNAIDAVEFMDKKWIKISAKHKGQFLEIRVTDSGTSIPLETQEKMFQPFFTSKEIGKGTGLGLSLSLTIVKNHQGELFLDKESANTSFILKLPIKRITAINA